MKKIVLTAAIAFAAFSTVNAQVNANDETPGTSDAVTVLGTLGLVDMIDLVPEFQVAGNLVNTWAEYNNGVTLIEAWPNTPPGGTAIEFRISATRKWKVDVKSTNFVRVGGGDVINNGDFSHSTANISLAAPATTPAIASLTSSDQTCATGMGAYNRMFIANVSLKPNAAYNHLGGTYNGTLTYTATLVP